MNHVPRIALVLTCFASAARATPPRGDWMPKAKPLPVPTGRVIRVTGVDELFRAVKKVEPGGTILLADGHYRLPVFLDITTDDVTLRSESGRRDRVILDGIASRHGELVGITGCEGVTIADLTVRNVKWNGIKINSDRGAQRVTVHNCVIHNVWQRGIKAPAVPEEKQDELAPRGCRIQFCLFYNDRAKRFFDDETESPEKFNGNYIGGIDVKNTVDWRITDNVFMGIQGRTREGRGCIYISENGRGCVIERNVFVDCDIAIALGNPSLGYSPLQAIDCVARDNLVIDCPETGILASYTKDCLIDSNTIVDSKRNRLIWAQKTNAGLCLRGNLLVGKPPLLTTTSDVARESNVVVSTMKEAVGRAREDRVGQKSLSPDMWREPAETWLAFQTERTAATRQAAGSVALSDDTITAMRKVHEGFDGDATYVAQFGDSITYSMAFWAPMGYVAPEKHLPDGDGLPRTPKGKMWKHVINGARDKGPKHANYSGWRAGQLLKSIDGPLERHQPVAAIIMIGTNDIAGGKVPASYRADLEKVVGRCIDAHCIPILNTIPPRRGRDEAVAAANAIIRAIADKHDVPLVDYHAEILRRRPEQSWQGMLVSGDGVHPSGGKTDDFGDGNLANSGYALRTWMNFLAFRQLYFRVLHPDQARE